jgi:membrane protein insertase Oxa1/YidC/SpoIIIJ
LYYGEKQDHLIRKDNMEQIVMSAYIWFVAIPEGQKAAVLAIILFVIVIKLMLFPGGPQYPQVHE